VAGGSGSTTLKTLLSVTAVDSAIVGEASGDQVVILFMFRGPTLLRTVVPNSRDYRLLARHCRIMSLKPHVEDITVSSARRQRFHDKAMNVARTLAFLQARIYCDDAASLQRGMRHGRGPFAEL